MSSIILPENPPSVSAHADSLDWAVLTYGRLLVDPQINAGIANAIVDDEFGAGVCRLEYYPFTAFIPAETGWVTPYAWSKFNAIQQTATRRIYEAYDRSYVSGREDKKKKPSDLFLSVFAKDKEAFPNLVNNQQSNWRYMTSSGIFVLREVATENVLTMSQVQQLYKLNTNTTPPIERGSGWNTRLLRVLGKIAEEFGMPIICPVERFSQRHRNAGWSPHPGWSHAHPDILTMPDHCKEWFGRECLPRLIDDGSATMGSPPDERKMDWIAMLWGLVVANNHWGRYKERLPPVVMTPDDDAEDDTPSCLISKTKPKSKSQKRNR
jgi:hypothetical protein